MAKESNINRRYCSLREAAEYLGMSENSTKSFVKSIGALKQVPGIQRILIDLSAIDEYMDAQE